MGAKLELKEVREPSVVKSLVKKVLESPYEHEWSVQGLGMMRLYLDDNRRLHIWDSRLRVDNVSNMHTHPWNFRSHVVAGVVRNQRYYEVSEGIEYNRQKIFCGVGGGLVGSPEKTHLRLYGDGPEIYIERETYSELANEIHISNPEDGTVTIVNREFLDDVDHALVFWEEGDWVSAEPHIATYEEVTMVTQAALQRWF